MQPYASPLPWLHLAPTIILKIKYGHFHLHEIFRIRTEMSGQQEKVN